MKFSSIVITVLGVTGATAVPAFTFLPSTVTFCTYATIGWGGGTPPYTFTIETSGGGIIDQNVNTYSTAYGGDYWGQIGLDSISGVIARLKDLLQAAEWFLL